MSVSTRMTIPSYRSVARRTSQSLPPARLPVFRSVVAHPPAPFAADQAKAATATVGSGTSSVGGGGGKGKDKGKGKGSDASGGETVMAQTVTLSGSYQTLYTTAPRPLIPLTNSPQNHKLWNPPAADSVASRAIDKDESGRLARFAARFAQGQPTRSRSAARGGGAGVEADAGGADAGQFGVESDLAFLEGVSVQSPGTALGKRDIVGAPKSAKKGKK